MCYFSVTVVLRSAYLWTVVTVLNIIFKAGCSLIAIIHQFKARVLINAEEQR